ncbi:hypothetical protein HPB51_005243 [Rhipicephalus microplus]|uniref:Uncharacterized protein n=1 Tax=Rhipicephalus microplus TaxID=6941 RepID=A0A9J6DZ31_RHIMP|nr:hypothetical protein HPB51_005243 [Rhipicephalus microplus]
MRGRHSLRTPSAQPLTFEQRWLRDPKMAMALCSADVFEQLDDAARLEAYRSAVSEADVLRTELSQLRIVLEELKLVILKDHDAVEDHDAPKPPLDSHMKASHDFLCNLLAPIAEHIERLKLKMHETSDAESSTSAEESSALMNLKRCPTKQQRQARSDAHMCMSNSEDARDRLLSFAASSLPHFEKDLRRLVSPS